VAARAAALAVSQPDLVRADIGQISGHDPESEILYGAPVGLEPLRASLAECWNRTYDLSLTARHVAVTTGAAEALSLLLRAFAHERVVGLPKGYWENYENAVDLAGGSTVLVDYFDDEGRLDEELLRSRIQNAGIQVLVVNFPSNPTGAVLDGEEMKRLASAARAEDVIIIADDVYHRLRFDDQPPVSILQYAPERSVVVSSASKEYAIAGARVGYAICCEPAVTDRVLRKLVRANTGSPNVLGQRILLSYLEEDLSDLRQGKEPRRIQKLRDELRRRRDELVTVLKEAGFTLVGRAGHSPEGTIFLMAGLPDWWEGDDVAFAEHALESGCVSTVPGGSFGLPGSVRFSFGGMTAPMIAQLRQNLASLKSGA
jgi:aspartate/methionine/tyrosine aminotransferase